jgi:putative transposase
MPESIRSDNGPEFAVKAPQQWMGHVEVKNQFIDPGSPCKNG